MDVDIDGEIQKFQITARYGVNVEYIEKTVKDYIEAFRNLRKEYPEPSYGVADSGVPPQPPETKKPFELKPLAENEVPVMDD
jgi:hypothetical protein